MPSSDRTFYMAALPGTAIPPPPPSGFLPTGTLPPTMMPHRTGLTCSYCGQVFNDQFYIRTHMAECHSDQMQHKCSTCGKAYFSLRGLELHQQTHQGKLKCNFCPAEFVHKPSLYRHQKNMHRGKLRCPACPALFNLESALLNHQKRLGHFRKS